MNSKRRHGTSPRRAPASAGADRFGTVGVWLTVLAIVVLLPDAFTRWFLPKELLVILAAVCASFAPAFGRMSRLVWACIGVGALILLIAAFTSDNVLGALMGRWPRYEGLVALPVYVAATWIGSRLVGPSASVARISSLTRSLTVISLLIGVVSLLESMGLRPIVGTSDRPGSLLGNATDQGLIGAALAVLLMPPLVSAIVAARAKFISTASQRWSAADRADAMIWPVTLAVGVAASVVSVIVSVSRAGLLSLGVGMLVVATLQVVQRSRRSGGRAGWVATAWSASAVLALVGVVLAVPSMRARVLGLSDLALRTIQDRFMIWQETFAIVAERPLFGVGPSGFGDAVTSQHDAAWHLAVGPGTVLDSPHNWVLQAAAAGGVPLVLAALAFVVVVLVLGSRRLRSAAARPEAQKGARVDLLLGSLAAVIGLGVGLLTHFTAASTGIMLGLLIGILTARDPSALRHTNSRFLRRTRTIIFAAWFVVFAVFTAADIPLATGLQATTASEAASKFEQAQALRPWDADLTSIAAQALTARADGGDREAVASAVVWAERAVATLPHSLTARYTFAVAKRSEGDISAAKRLFSELHEEYPFEPRVEMQLGVTQIMSGEYAAGLEHLNRAQAASPRDESILRMVEWAHLLGEKNPNP